MNLPYNENPEFMMKPFKKDWLVIWQKNLFSCHD